MNTETKPETRIINGTVYAVVRPNNTTKAQRAAVLHNLTVEAHNTKQKALPKNKQEPSMNKIPVPDCIQLRRVTHKMSVKTARKMGRKNIGKLHQEYVRAKGAD